MMVSVVRAFVFPEAESEPHREGGDCGEQQTSQIVGACETCVREPGRKGSC